MEPDNISSFLNSDVNCVPERDVDRTSEKWFTEVESDFEWAENKSLFNSSSFSTITNTGTTDDINNSAIFEDFADKSDSWKTSDNRYAPLLGENERLKSQLLKEKHRSAKFLNKLKFIQDNYEIFNRLKEAYLNMKYNESANRPLVEIREKGCQTWKGILCKNCLDTAEIRKKLNLNDDNNMVLIRKEDLDSLRTTFNGLKENLMKHELTNVVRDQRELKFRKTIGDLLEENIRLKDRVDDQQKEIEDLTKSLQHKKTTSKESSSLKKIIVKLQKKLRKESDSKTSLNEKEKKIIKRIQEKYDIKKQIKNSGPCSSGSTHDQNLTPYMTPRASVINELQPEESPRTYRSIEEVQIQEVTYGIQEKSDEEI